MNIFNHFLCRLKSTVMTPPSNKQQIGLRLGAVLAILIVSLLFLPSKSVGLKWSTSNGGGERAEVAQRSKKVLGSRPPGCINKCMKCQPCEATLVIPPHQKKGSSGFMRDHNIQAAAAHREDDSYYLLSWKCRCGNKLFQP